MKRILLIAACIVASVGALAQGTVNFANKVTADSIDAPVLNVDGTKLAGSAYMAQLYAGASEASLNPMGVAVPFKVNGYFSGGETLITGISPGGSAFVQVRAWAAAGGANYEAAVAANVATGMSPVLSMAGTGNPNKNPPDLPLNMVGLQGFQLSGGGGVIPEPTTIALGALAAGALLLFRRK